MLFSPPMDPENENFEKKLKNTQRYYHFTNLYHDSHMTHSSRDMECDRQNCFVILDNFLPP